MTLNFYSPDYLPSAGIRTKVHYTVYVVRRPEAEPHASSVSTLLTELHYIFNIWKYFCFPLDISFSGLSFYLLYHWWVQGLTHARRVLGCWATPILFTRFGCHFLWHVSQLTSLLPSFLSFILKYHITKSQFVFLVYFTKQLLCEVPKGHYYC